jgi:hypothetical protein
VIPAYTSSQKTAKTRVFTMYMFDNRRRDVSDLRKREKDKEMDWFPDVSGRQRLSHLELSDQHSRSDN